jgi:hypothetical protein
MPRKQATVNESSAAAAPARAAKPKAPRVQSAKHTKAAASEPAAVTEKNPAVEVPPATAVDSAAIASALQAQLPVEQIETSLFSSASAADTASSELAAPAANGDSREEIARIAYGYWVARGYVAGDPLEDWVRAENEYRQRLGR